MAGSWNHITDDNGALLRFGDYIQMIDTLGDAYEATEEMYGMIQLLAGGDEGLIKRARNDYKQGLVRADLPAWRASHALTASEQALGESHEQVGQAAVGAGTVTFCTCGKAFYSTVGPGTSLLAWSEHASR